MYVYKYSVDIYLSIVSYLRAVLLFVVVVVCFIVASIKSYMSYLVTNRSSLSDRYQQETATATMDRTTGSDRIT